MEELERRSPDPAAGAASDGQRYGSADLLERVAHQAPRVHINTGAVCNNNCVFCMEEDRDARERENGALTFEDVKTILARSAGAEEICFTSGEPTTNPRLPDYVRAARGQGFARVSVMTNGRMLSQVPYAQQLLLAGLNRFYVSIHGHEPRLHEGLTRTPGSFAQTVRGLDVLGTFRRRFPLDLHTSTVITRRNLPHLGDIYRFLRAHGVDQVVFNVMQANGRADTHFEQIFPRYTEIAAAFRAFLDGAEETRAGQPVMAFLVDIPPCTTEGIADFNRGYVEAHTHYGALEEAARLFGAADLLPEGRSATANLVELRRSDLDATRRLHRDECQPCRYRATCEGVWGNYLRRHGWDEFQPV